MYLCHFVSKNLKNIYTEKVDHIKLSFKPKYITNLITKSKYLFVMLIKLF